MGSLLRRQVVAAVMALAVGLLVASSATARTVRSGAGTLQLGPPSLIWEKAVGNSTITYEDGSLSFAGTITGSGTVYVLAVHPPSGGETFVARWNAPATVNGRSGVLHLRAVGTDNGVFAARFVVRGTGGLSGFSGSGSLTGQDATGQGTYTVHYGWR